MLTRADNEYLCHTGPGTPMGEFFRRFWLPALMPSELPEPDCAPVRLKLLSEELVAWRNTDGSLGVMQNACPHRGASMFFGRNEENGLRCVYHGWKFDVTGACVDMPNEPAESNFKHKIHAAAYPAAEWGGLVWVYMGPAGLKPELPQMEWCLVPDSHRYVQKWRQECNWAQAMEGEIDSSHISYLHRILPDKNAAAATPVVRGLQVADGAPQLTLKETEYGFMYGARRTLADSRYYWRVTQFMLPNFSYIPNEKFPRGGRCWIPMDDEHIWAFAYAYNPNAPLTDAERAFYGGGVATVPKLIPGTFMPEANYTNDYQIDREAQRTKTYTGIFGVRNQDMAVTESMGGITDRSAEHLGTADQAIILARRIVMRLARELEGGKEPYAAGHGDVYRIRPLDVLDTEGDFAKVVEKHAAEAVAVRR